MGFGQFFHSFLLWKECKVLFQNQFSDFSENHHDNRLGFGAISETRTTLDQTFTNEG
jgi:hypothetical protein